MLADELLMKSIRVVEQMMPRAGSAAAREYLDEVRGYLTQYAGELLEADREERQANEAQDAVYQKLTRAIQYYERLGIREGNSDIRKYLNTARHLSGRDSVLSAEIWEAIRYRDSNQLYEYIRYDRQNAELNRKILAAVEKLYAG